MIAYIGRKTTPCVLGVSLLILGWARQANADITNGLIGWWTLDGRVGTTVHDFSGQNNVGTLSGATFNTATTTGVIRTAVTFDGINDSVSIPTVKGWTNTAVTYAVWCKRLGANPNWTQVLSGPAGAIYVQPHSNTLRFQLGTSGGTRFTDASPFPSNEWIHLAGTFSYGDRLRLYINGVQIGESAAAYEETMSAGTAFGLCTPYSGQYLKVVLDDGRAYNRALSAADIEELYTARISPPAGEYGSGLIGHWSFDESSGAMAKDLSPYINHATLINMDASTSATNGVFGRALAFNGINQYASVSPINGWNSNAVTVAVWAKKLANPSGYSQLFGGGGALYVSSGGGLFFQLALAGLGNQQSGGVTLGSEWTHVAGTFSRSDRVRLYINGALAQQSGAAYDTWISPWTSLWFARYASGTYMNVALDEARIYNRALTGVDIEELYFYHPPPPRGSVVTIK